MWSTAAAANKRSLLRAIACRIRSQFGGAMSSKKSVCWSVALASLVLCCCVVAEKSGEENLLQRAFSIHNWDDDKIASVLVRLAAEMFIFRCHIYIA